MFFMGDVYRTEYQILLAHLRQARKAARLTQTEVAKRLGKTQGYVNKLETGERRMDVVQLRDFCAAIGVDFVEFMQHYNAAVEVALTTPG
jgi:transcriptional regulator with XRE-family HTH domain